MDGGAEEASDALRLLAGRRRRRALGGDEIRGISVCLRPSPSMG